MLLVARGHWYFPLPRDGWYLWPYGLKVGLLDVPPYEAIRPERKRGLFGGLKVLFCGYFLLRSPLSEEALLMILAAFVRAVSASTCETISFWNLGPKRCFPASGKSPLAYLERLGSVASSIRTRRLSQKRLFALPRNTSARCSASRTKGICMRASGSLCRPCSTI